VTLALFINVLIIIIIIIISTRYTHGYYRPLIKCDMWHIVPSLMTLIDHS